MVSCIRGGGACHGRRLPPAVCRLVKVCEPVLAEGVCAVAPLSPAPKVAAPVTLVGFHLDQGDDFGLIDIDTSMLDFVREADVEAKDEQVLFPKRLCVPAFRS